MFLRCSSGFCFYQLSLLFSYEGVVRNGKSTAGHQRYLCSHAVKHGSYSSLTPLLNPVRIKNHWYGHEWRRMSRQCTHYGVGLNTVLRHLKTQAAVGNLAIQPGSDVIVCAEMDEQWGYAVLNHVSAGCFTRMTGYGGRCGARIRWTHSGHAGASSGPASAFEVVVWMTDAWPLYESRRRESCALSASVTLSALSDITESETTSGKAGTEVTVVLKIGELHDKVIGHYLNIKHYQ